MASESGWTHVVDSELLQARFGYRDLQILPEDPRYHLALDVIEGAELRCAGELRQIGWNKAAAAATAWFLRAEARYWDLEAQYGRAYARLVVVPELARASACLQRLLAKRAMAEQVMNRGVVPSLTVLTLPIVKQQLFVFSPAAEVLRCPRLLDKPLPAQLQLERERMAKWGADGCPPQRVRHARILSLGGRFRSKPPAPAFFAACVNVFTEADMEAALTQLRAARQEELMARALNAVQQRWVIWPVNGRWPAPSWGQRLQERADTWLEMSASPPDSWVGEERRRRHMENLCWQAEVRGKAAAAAKVDFARRRNPEKQKAVQTKRWNQDTQGKRPRVPLARCTHHNEERQIPIIFSTRDNSAPRLCGKEEEASQRRSERVAAKLMFAQRNLENQKAAKLRRSEISIFSA